MTIRPARRRRTRTHLARVPLIAAILGILATAACSGPPSSDVFRLTTPPGPPVFDQVSDGLAIHCGTLNCHGNDARNMRFFGFYGTRLAPNDKPGAGATSPDEYEANFESVISIEPERLSQIVQSGGSNTALEDKWIVLSKGRGTEHHKGGSRMTKGDAMDTCITSWLASRGGGVPGDGGAVLGLNTDACKAAATIPAPGVPCPGVPPPCSDWNPAP